MGTFGALDEVAGQVPRRPFLKSAQLHANIFLGTWQRRLAGYIKIMRPRMALYYGALSSRAT